LDRRRRHHGVFVFRQGYPYTAGLFFSYTIVSVPGLSRLVAALPQAAAVTLTSSQPAAAALAGFRRARRRCATRIEPLLGGSVNESWRVDTDPGQPCCIDGPAAAPRS
jgi:hypothetical protein